MAGVGQPGDEVGGRQGLMCPSQAPRELDFSLSAIGSHRSIKAEGKRHLLLQEGTWKESKSRAPTMCQALSLVL